MQAIILSAGRGSRLLPLTTDIVTGFNAHLVETELAGRSQGPNVKTKFNPFYQVADNLASCWMVRKAMKSDFLIINGDTLFSPELLAKVLAAPAADITVTIDKKDQYDGDDMKVTLEGSQLLSIGKTLTPQQTQGESIGMLRFIFPRQTFKARLGQNLIRRRIMKFAENFLAVQRWLANVSRSFKLSNRSRFGSGLS